MALRYIAVAIATFVVGYVLSDALYRRHGKRLRGSRLEIKIVMWIPLFCAALIFAYGNGWLRLALLAFVLWQLCLEVIEERRRLPLGAILFVVAVGAGLVSLLGVASLGPSVFLAVWFMSVVSDVAAFFAGNFAGRHKLPARFNRRKSWEGVVGQLAGAALACGLLNSLVVAVPLCFILTVGVGSVLGDLTNSYIKRRVGLQEWSNRVPGHGGYLDRFASLASASLLTMLTIWL